MAGPYPVVGVAAELADGRGRRGDQPHVVELLVEEEKLLVAVVHLLDSGLVAFALGFGLADDFVGRLACGHAVGHLLHADEEADVKVSVGQLLVARAGPETAGQIIVFER